jgi:SAM-dependent methyltransferase
MQIVQSSSSGAASESSAGDSSDPSARNGKDPARPAKLRAGAIARSIAGRVFHPAHLTRAIKLQRGRRGNKRSFEDAQLALLAQILPGGYLHYGYFDDPTVVPEEMSLRDIQRAQERYAELLVELAQDTSAPVLDVGCGMGGMSKLLLTRGFSPTALTPDRLQAEHIRRTYPEIPLIQSKFEDLPDQETHAGRYGTVFTSESLQYLKLDRALPLMEKILKPGGRWIACDYFRTGEAREKSGHRWDAFTALLDARGWEIDYQRDITPHILPTLRFIHMWATRFGLPMMQFGLLKLQNKQPAVHYVLEGVLRQVDEVVSENIETIDPEAFAARKKYVLMTMRLRP